MLQAPFTRVEFHHSSLLHFFLRLYECGYKAAPFEATASVQWMQKNARVQCILRPKQKQWYEARHSIMLSKHHQKALQNLQRAYSEQSPRDLIHQLSPVSQ